MAYLKGELPNGLLVSAALVPAAFVFDVLDGRIARWRQKQSALGRELDSLAYVISFGVAPASLAFGAGIDVGWDALVPLAFIFDALDGRIARWRQQHSALGRELDSLADVISFGVAPAALAFGTGLDGGWDAFVLMYFVACGVSRLARYNITAEALADEASGKVKYFEGTPIPTSVLLVAIMALAAWRGHSGDAIWGGGHEFAGLVLHPLVLLYLLSGSLMISKTIHIPKL